MRKLVNLLVRKEGMTAEEFETYWFEEHAPLADSLDGIRKYTTSVPSDQDRAAYDGIAELYLEEGVTVADVFETPAGERIQEDTANFLDNEASELLIVDETVQFGEE